MYDKLLPFQKDAAEFILRTKTVALFAEQGTGKTWVTAGVIEKLVPDEPEILLIVPLSNKITTWERMLEQVADLTICHDLAGFKKARGAKVLLLHYESIARVKARKRTPFTKRHWDVVIADESQKIKGRASKQSRFLGLMHNVDYRIALSGTPFDDLAEEPQEIWAQARFFAPQVFGKRWKDFEEEFLKPGGWMGKKRVFSSRRAQQEVIDLIKPYCLRITKKESLDLPPLKYHNIPVELLGSQARIYGEMNRDSVTEVDDVTITAGLAVTQVIRLQQICGGFIKDDDGDLHKVGNAKLRKLKSVMKRVEKPIVIFAKYVAEIDEVRQALSGGNCNVSTIQGKNRKTRVATQDAFQRGEIDVLIVQVRAGGVGIDLFRAATAIFYSANYSWIDFDQAVSRLHRKGQERTVNIYLLYAKNTVDKLIYDSLLLKRSFSEYVLRNFKHRSRRPTMAKPKTKPAKEAKKAAPEPEKTKKEAAPKADASKYGITDLADLLGIEPASARVRLRAAGIEKVGGRYGWDTKAELAEVAGALKSDKPAKKAKSKKAKDEDDDDDEDLDDEE